MKRCSDCGHGWPEYDDCLKCEKKDIHVDFNDIACEDFEERKDSHERSGDLVLRNHSDDDQTARVKAAAELAAEVLRTPGKCD